MKVVENHMNFFIPSLPPSMNAIYQIIFQARIVQLKPEVRAWKTEVKKDIPLWRPVLGEGTDGTLWIKMVFVGDWYTKKGKVRKVDLSNLEKVVVDAICEKVGIDDSFVWKVEKRKEQGTENRGIRVSMGLNIV